jgi:hypothetical protein
VNFLNWRTNEELLQIINTDSIAPEFRMKAAIERIKRVNKPCLVPGCKNHAGTTWATVPVCAGCKDRLKLEQQDYYLERMNAAERTLLNQIKPLFPWKDDAEAAG